jgi:hypothetical protein
MIIVTTTLFAAMVLAAVVYDNCCNNLASLEDRLLFAIVFGAAFAVIATARMRFLVLPRRARRLVRNYPWLYNDASATLDEDGFVLRSQHCQINWQWAELDGFREDDAIFLLCPPRDGYIIPKRRFSAEDFAALDALIRRKLRKLG